MFGNNSRRLDFARWYIHQSETHRGVCSSILFTDEVCFTREAFFNSHNSHVWTEDNPHATGIQSYQKKSLLMYGQISPIIVS